MATEPASTPKRSQWRTRGVLLVGAIVALVALYRFSEGLAISLSPVVVREATQNDKVYEEEHRYFGICPAKSVTIRNIAIAEGTFTKSTWLSASLYAVQAGKSQKLNAFTVGRSPNRIGEPIWIHMKITLALGTIDRPDGQVVMLGAAGHTRGVGQGGGEDGPAYNFATTEKTTLPESLRSGRQYIVHVEGDKQCEVSRDMTLEAFAARNEGNYFVVVVRLN